MLVDTLKLLPVFIRHAVSRKKCMPSVEMDVAVVTPGSKGCRKRLAKMALGKPWTSIVKIKHFANFLSIEMTLPK